MAGVFNVVTLVLVLGLCHRYHGYVRPVSLHIWRHQIEAGVRALEIQAGSRLTLTCDGSEVSRGVDPRLRWYGPDKRWIENQGGHNRVHVERSFTRRYLQLTFRRVQPDDGGLYYCRGWMGTEHRWDLKSIRLVVRNDNVTPQHATTRGANTRDRPVPQPRPTIRVPLSPSARVSTSSPVGPSGCALNQFRCGSGVCIDNSNVCNHTPDCEDASDEQNCATSICAEGMIACRDGVGCVQSSQVCDHVAQCSDASDEDPKVCSL